MTLPPTRNKPISGAIHTLWYSTVQPYSSSPSGIKKTVIINSGILYSGRRLLYFLHRYAYEKSTK